MNVLFKIQNVYKVASSGIAHTRNDPFCRLKVSDTPVPSGDFHSTSPKATLGILAYALVSPKAGEGIDARAFAAKTAARLRTYS